MSDNKQTSFHWLVGGILAIVGIFAVAGHVMLSSQADDVTTQATINNSAPTVDSVTISGTIASDTDDFGAGITLSPNTTKQVYVNGYISDLNGIEDITAIEGFLYKSDQSSACSYDANNCYQSYWNDVPASDTCTVSQSDSDTYRFSCDVDMYYFADDTSATSAAPTTNWVAYVSVSDGTAADNDASKTTEVNTLLSLSIPASLTFSDALTAGTATTDVNNAALTVTQTGNDGADVNVSMASAMSCSSRGTIPVNQIEWSLTDTEYSNAANADLSTSASDTNVGVSLQTDDGSQQTKTLYFNILPSAGVEGTCSGTLVIESIAS